MKAPVRTFGIGLGDVFRAGIGGYFRQPAPLSLAGAVTLATYLLFRIQAQHAYDAAALGRSILLDLAGLVLASLAALSWYAGALAADRGLKVDLSAPFHHRRRFTAQAVASFWFWAAVLFGLRYLYGIPSLLALTFYAFYGYVVTEGESKGLRALGQSVRLGQGRRVGLFAVGLIFLVFNLLGALPLGYAVNPFTTVLASLGILVTTNITIVAGARIYRTLTGEVS